MNNSRIWLLSGFLCFSTLGCKPEEPKAATASTASEESAKAEPRPCEQWVASGEARQIVEDGGLFLDVRSAEEYEVAHLDGAQNIDVEELEGRVSEVPEAQQVVVYCRSGRRAHRAAEILKANGRQVAELGTMDRYETNAPVGCPAED
jgi:rhodanese-related sulfurtransferase